MLKQKNQKKAKKTLLPMFSSQLKCSEQSVLVLGNGKSLAKYNFAKYQVETIGMNRAYRYWDKIGWYPNYYVVIDPEINGYFGHDIYRLVKKRKTYGIKKFILSRIILEKYPQIAKYHGSVLFIEDLIKKQAFGFQGKFQKTAGSVAARLGLYLGFKKVYVLGVDANFRPFNMKWAKSLMDSKGFLKRTINPEPTYFFVGYRKKGDKMHIPPVRRRLHRANHYHSFGDIHRRYNKSYHRVVNSNPTSNLKIKNVIPFEVFPEQLKKINLK